MPETLQQLLDQEWPVTKEQLTPRVIKKLREEIQKEPTSDRAENLRKLDELIQKTNEWARASLTALKEQLETPIDVEYSMEWVRELNNSEIFELFFERPEIKAIYQGWISEKIQDYPYLAEHQTTIELTVWKHLVDQMSFTGLMWYAWGKISDYVSGKFTNITEALSSWVSEWVEVPGGIDGLSTLLESVEWVADALGNGEWEEEKVTGFIENIQGFIEDITKDYFDNIGALDIALKEQWYISKTWEVLKPEVQSLLSNPFAISQIWKKWKYEGKWSIVRLWENSTISISTLTPEKTEELQDSFMQEIGKLTSKNGEKIDSLRKQTKKIAKLLSKFWFDSESLQWFQDFLEWIPGVGVFLASLLWFFINDSVLSELDEIGMPDSQKKALRSLKSFIQDSENSEDLPFVLREKNLWVLTGKETRNLRSFIWKINKSIPWEWEEKEAETQKVFEDPKFSEKIFTGKWIWESETVMKKAHDTIMWLFPNGSKPTQEDFFRKLAETNLTNTIDNSKEEETSIPETGEIIPELSKALSFPFIYNWTEVNYNSENYELQVGEKAFKISTIADISVNDTLLKMANPQIILWESITLKYSLGAEQSMEIEKSFLSDLLDQLVSWGKWTLTIPQGADEDSNLMILFEKVK